MSDERLWYFAYGSNLDPDRFRQRVGAWHDRVAARLDGWRLRFSADVQSEGGGGAIIVPQPESAVYGAAFLIDARQMAAMDEEEFDPRRDTDGRGKRCQVAVIGGGQRIEAQVYSVPAAGEFRAPSARYLGHITRGLRDVGHDESVVAEVEAIAAAGG